LRNRLTLFPATAGGRLSTPCGCGLADREQRQDADVTSTRLALVAAPSREADLRVAPLVLRRCGSHTLRVLPVDEHERVHQRTGLDLAVVEHRTGHRLSGFGHVLARALAPAEGRSPAAILQDDTAPEGDALEHRSLAHHGRALDNRRCRRGDHGGWGLDHRGDHRLGLLRLLLDSHCVGS
jgi:hypothetical protein